MWTLFNDGFAHACYSNKIGFIQRNSTIADTVKSADTDREKIIAFLGIGHTV